MIRIDRAGAAVALLAWGGLAWAQEGVPHDAANDEPKPAAAGTFHAPTRLSAADGVIDSGESWAHCGPWVEDVVGEGKRDLVVGDFSGLFRLYRNEGTDKEPRYARSVNLQAGGEDAKVRIY